MANAGRRDLRVEHALIFGQAPPGGGATRHRSLDPFQAIFLAAAFCAASSRLRRASRSARRIPSINSSSLA
jgi:hypothetical protein